MSKKNGYYFVVVALALFIPTCLILAYNVYTDPFQILHKDFKRPVVLIDKGQTEAYQHAGVINNYQIKSIVLGNSYASNYLPSELEAKLGVKNARNLAMNGAPIAEQIFPAKSVLKKNEVEYVLWGISDSNLMQEPDRRNPKRVFPEYLYDDKLFNDLQFFMTVNLREYHLRKKELRKAILKAPDPDQAAEQVIDRSTAWYWKNKNRFDRPVFVAQDILGKKKLNYAKNQRKKLRPFPYMIKEEGLKENEYFKEKIRNCTLNIQRNIIPLVKAHPNIRFDFVFTAFPALYSQKQKIYKRISYITKFYIVKEFVTIMSQFNNVRIFVFGLEKFTEDLRLYKDSSHYHIAVNNYILNAIARNENRLTKENLDIYLIEFDKKISHYRLPEKWNPRNIKKIRSKGKKISQQEAMKLI